MEPFTKEEAELIAQIIKEKAVPFGIENGEKMYALGSSVLRKCEAVMKEAEPKETINS